MAKKFNVVATALNITGGSLKSKEEIMKAYEGTRATASQGETSLNKAFVYVFLNAFADMKRAIRQQDGSLRETTWAAMVCGRIGLTSQAVSNATISVNSITSEYVVVGESKNVPMIVNLADFVHNFREISNLDVCADLIEKAEKENKFIAFRYKDSVNGHKPNQFDTIDRPRDLFEIVFLDDAETKILADSGLIKAA